MFSAIFRLTCAAMVGVPIVYLFNQFGTPATADLPPDLKIVLSYLQSAWDNILNDPTPWLSALATMVVMFLYHKIKGRGTREALEAAVSRSTTIIVPQPPAPPRESEGHAIRAVNTLAVAKLREHLEKLHERKAKLPQEIKELETECAHAEKAQLKAKEAYDKLKKEHEDWENSRKEAVKQQEEIEGNIAQTKKEIERLEQVVL